MIVELVEDLINRVVAICRHERSDVNKKINRDRHENRLIAVQYLLDVKLEPKYEDMFSNGWLKETVKSLRESEEEMLYCRNIFFENFKFKV